MRKGDFFTRHTTRPGGGEPESARFKGVSEKGVELARERAREILASLIHLEPGTVVFMGGTSEIPRTKSTMAIYGEEIKRIAMEEKRDDILVFLPEDLKDIEGYSRKVAFLVDHITAHPEKKIVIDIPLFILEFSWVDDFTTKEGTWTPYVQALLKLHEGKGRKVFQDWLEHQGIHGELKGPHPKEVAKKQLAGLNRLRAFVTKYLPGRPIVIGCVGHSWSLDALAVYLANNGEVTVEAWNALNTKMIGETEMISIMEKDGKPFLQYGDKEIPLEDGENIKHDF
jgi:hypothetical protein